MIPLQCQVIAIGPRRVSGSTIFRGLGRLVEIGLECAGRLQKFTILVRPAHPIRPNKG
jgi:hypothetical protein